MIPLIVVGILNMIMVSLMWPGTCRIEWRPVAKFLGIMAAVTALRCALAYFVGVPTDAGASVTASIPMWTFLLVFWEDAFFSLPALIVEKLGGSKFDVWATLGFCSLAFASGHVAYGLPWMFFTLLYVSQFSYKFGKEFGFGTVMLCHILYDMITYSTIRWLL